MGVLIPELCPPPRQLWTPQRNGDFALHVGFHVQARNVDTAEIVWDETGHNLIVNRGKRGLLAQLAGITTVPFIYMGVGTDLTAAAVTHTQLNPTVAGSVLIQACDATFPSVTAIDTTPVVATYQSTFGTGVANFAWNEWALASGTVNGTSQIFDRSVFGPFAKTSAVSIVLIASISQA